MAFRSAVAVVASVQMREWTIPSFRVRVRIKLVSAMSADLEAEFLWVKLGNPTEKGRLTKKLSRHGTLLSSHRGLVTHLLFMAGRWWKGACAVLLNNYVS